MVVAICSPSCLRPAGAASAASINRRDVASVCRVAPARRASYVPFAETPRAARESDSTAPTPLAPVPVPELSPALASGSICRPVALRAAVWPAAPPGQLPVTTGVVIGSIDIVGCAVPAGQAMVIHTTPPRQALAAQQGVTPQPLHLPSADMQFLRCMQSMSVPTPGQPTPPQHRSPALAPTPAPSAFKAFVRLGATPAYLQP